MLLDFIIADFLLSKRLSIKKVKLYLILLYYLINVFLYITIFRQINNHIIGVILFLLVTFYFQIIRTSRLSKYLSGKTP